MTETSPSDAPVFKAAGFKCPRCGRVAHQDWKQFHVLNSEEDDFEVFNDAPQSAMLLVARSMEATVPNPGPADRARAERRWADDAQQWWASRCYSCKRSSVWRGGRLLYPRVSTAPVAHADMPAEAQELYDEAREVFAVSPRAGAALARATLERLLRQLDPEAGNIDLAARIERIVPKVSSSLAQMLTVIRGQQVSPR